MRQILLFTHRWLGLTAGLIFAITALTGGILVYQDELNELLVGPWTGITPGLADPQTIEWSVRHRYPDGRLVRVEWPTPETKVFRVRMTDGRGQHDLELDPGSGTVLQPRRLHIVLAAIRRLHASLLMGSIGRPIVRYATGASIVSLLVGLYLWWSGVRSLARGFRIRFARGLHTLIFDLHQTCGVIALPLLLIMTATGVLMDSPALRVLFEGRGTGTSPTALQSQVPPEIAAPDIDLGTAARVIQTETGGVPILRVDFPITTNGVIDGWTHRASGWPHAATTRLALDRHTGALLARQNLAYDANINSRLHFGRIGGAVLRVLYSASCFVGSGLLFTGLVMWRKRRKPSAIAGGQKTGRT